MAGEPGAGECGITKLGNQEDNLVSKAVSVFRERTGFNDGLLVFLEKRIPVGAGLGGGSSDAASTLLALNFLAGEQVKTEELVEMAAILGSDVPFFLFGGLAFISGRGEQVERIESPGMASLKRLWVVLVKPPFSSDTAAAYRLLDKSRELTMKCEPAVQPGLRACDSARKGEQHEINRSCDFWLNKLEKDPGTWPFKNDFLPVFLDAKSEYSASYQVLLDNLMKAGASFASLSGAGSCCFGIFTVKEKAENALKTLSIGGNFARLTFFLANRVNPVVE